MERRGFKHFLNERAFDCNPQTDPCTQKSHARNAIPVANVIPTMRRPTSIPPGKAGLIVLAIAFAPLALATAKPAMRAIGRGIKKFGEATERMFGEANKPEPPTEPAETPTEEPEPKVAKKKSSKKG